MEGDASPVPCKKLSCSDTHIVLPPMNVWIQGIIVDIRLFDQHYFILVDDGTGTVFVSILHLEWKGQVMEKGCYVFFQGPLVVLDSGHEIDINGSQVKRFINVCGSGFIENVNMETFWLLSLLEG